MNRSLFLGAILLIFNLFFSLSCKPEKNKTDAGQSVPNMVKPNILLIVADDLGEEVGVYGDSIAITPNIDKFAEEGVQFTNAYVTQASCSPSRSSILTGLYPHQSGQVGLSHLGISMNKEYPNLFSILKKQGYRNGIMGKLHVEPYGGFPFDWGVGGFDVIHPNEDKKNQVVEVLETDGTRHKIVEKFTRYDIPVMADSAMAFIKQDDNKPFFLMMNFLDPHKPFRNQINGHPKKVFSEDEIAIPPYCGGNATSKQEVAGYYNGVARFDEGLGYTMKMLDSLGLRNNTIIILLGDHGAPLPRAKMTAYEAGLRIPMMVQFPQGKYAGTKENALVSTTDILPTILEALNIKEIPEGVTGISWFQLLNKTVEKRNYMFGEYTQHLPEQYFPQRTINNGRYKLIYSPFALIYAKYFNSENKVHTRDIHEEEGLRITYRRYASTPEIALYDLEADPHEFKNIADNSDLADTLKTLQKELNKWMMATGDPLLQEKYQVKTENEILQFLRKFTSKKH